MYIYIERERLLMELFFGVVAKMSPMFFDVFFFPQNLKVGSVTDQLQQDRSAGQSASTNNPKPMRRASLKCCASVQTTSEMLCSSEASEDFPPTPYRKRR